MPPLRLLVTPLAGLVFGCADGGGDVTRRLAAACESTSNMGEALCACVAEEAESDLSPKARELLLAMVEQDEDQVETLRGEVSFQETMAAGTFLVRAPAACAQRGITSEEAP